MNGDSWVMSDLIEVGYYVVYFWVVVVEKVKFFDVDKVKKVVDGIVFKVLGGIVKIDGDIQYFYKMVRIG